MRRLPDDAHRQQHSNLLRLAPEQRLFVQRWIELFDRDVLVELRMRPQVATRVEADGHLEGRRPDWHHRLIEAELDSAEPTLMPDVETLEAEIRSDPVAAAERLARAVIDRGHSSEFLFQAFRAMLYPPDQPFAERLRGLLDWWRHAEEREIGVAVRLLRNGGLPRGTRPCGYGDLSDALREAMESSRAWHRAASPRWREQEKFVLLQVPARDPNSAAARARERFETVAAIQQQSRRRPAELEHRWFFIDDPHQWPAPKAYALTLGNYRYPLPNQISDPGAAAALQDAASLDESLAVIARNYLEALRILRERDDPNEAAKHIFQVHEVCLDGVVSGPQETQWGEARRFVELGSLLLTLQYPSRLFLDLYRFCARTSYLLGGRSALGEERRPELFYDALAAEPTFAALQAHYPWDELLLVRRREVLGALHECGAQLPGRREVFRYDLARAVRLRNHMFHRGHPLEDQHLLAMMLTTVEQIIDLRIAALREGLSFGDVVATARRDFADWTSGAWRPPARLYGPFGWRRQRSANGSDLAVPTWTDLRSVPR